MNIYRAASLIPILWISSVCAMDIVNKAQGRIESGRYHSLDGSYSIQIPGLDSPAVRVSDSVVSPGITHQVSFVGDLGRMSVVISTKIRDEFPKDDRVLQRVAANDKQQFMRQGGYLEDLHFIGDQEGRVLQCVVRYCGIGPESQLRDGFTGKLVPRKADVFGVHRYVVRKGYLYEFTVMAPHLLPPSERSENGTIQAAITDSTELISGFQIDGKGDDKLNAMLKEYKLKEGYIIHAVELPQVK